MPDTHETPGIPWSKFEHDDREIMTLATALVSIDDKHEQDGWDGPVVLYRLVEDPKFPEALKPWGRALTANTMVLGEYAPAPMELEAMALVFKMKAEVELDGPDGDEIRKEFANAFTTPTVAHVYVCEVWGQIDDVTGMADSLEEELAAMEGKPLDEMHGLVEARISALVTNDHLLMTCRERGKEIQISVFDRRQDGEHFGGDSIYALMSLHDSTDLITRKLREGT
jgi:hypothetical protein